MSIPVSSATLAQSRLAATANFTPLLPKLTAPAPNLTDEKKFDFLNLAKKAVDSVDAIGKFENKDFNHNTFFERVRAIRFYGGNAFPDRRLKTPKNEEGARYYVQNAYNKIFESTKAKSN